LSSSINKSSLSTSASTTKTFRFSSTITGCALTSTRTVRFH
jgi:hypothetical protein